MIDTNTLRKKIIDLAVAGKLTDHSVGNASEELGSIIKMLNNNEQRLIKDEEKWINIPSNWTWSRLADLTNNNSLNDGDWVLSKDMVSQGSVRLIQLGSIGDCEYRYKGFKYLTEDHFIELNGKQIYPGYLLINRLVVNKMLACIIPPMEGILMTAVDVCWVAPNEELYNLEYIMYALSSSGVQQKVKELGHGVTRFRISKLNLIDIPFPLPPLSEQNQIVDKLNELFLILKKIDNLQEQYVLDYDRLKDKVIEAGISGHLTLQLDEDGDAKNLFEKLKICKADMVQKGIIKKEKKLPDISFAEEPFPIPDTWKWVHFSDLYSLSNGVASRGSQDGKPHPVLRLADLTSGQIDTEDIRCIDLTDSEFNSHKIHKDDLVFIRVNGSRDKVANAFLYTGEEEISYCDHLFCGHKISDLFEPSYVMFAYHSGMVKRQIDSEIKTTAGQNTINQKSMSKIMIPLPPTAEQKRIVAKLNELLSSMPQ